MDDILLGLILERLDRDSPGEAASNLLLAACEGDDALAAAVGGESILRPALPAWADPKPAEPAGAFITSVTVSGFRGIGPAATLKVPPGPGLTVVTGRNGSGKSSFAEALEVLLTGGLRRWDDRSAVWREGWRNLHDADAPSIRAELVLEGAGRATAERHWPAAAAFPASEATVQVAGEPGSGLERLGWAAALNAYRPFLSHAELEAFFGKPSELHDLLISVLGLDDLTATSERLSGSRKSRESALTAAKKSLVGLLETLAGSDDERSVGVRAALAGRRWDLANAVSLSTGMVNLGDDGELGWLQRAAQVTVPPEEEILGVARRLRDAATGLDALGGSESAQARDLVLLLSAAIAHHRVHGDGECPVCGRQDGLDRTWLQQTEQTVLRLRRQSANADAAVKAAEAVQRDAANLIQPCPSVLTSSPIAEVDVAPAARYWGTWAAAPKGLDAAGLRAMADHLEGSWGELAAAVHAVADQATGLLAARQDAWAPLAKSVLTWCDTAGAAQQAAAAVPDLKKAEAWLKAATNDIRNARVGPIADHARAIWSQLRQESNVALGDIRLSGSRTSREVDIDVRVDGSDATALGVMSQGEVNALALSVFLPRATLPNSPFRFLILDDPVQAMDPAKVDGLARVLEKRAVAARSSSSPTTTVSPLPSAASPSRPPCSK